MSYNSTWHGGRTDRVYLETGAPPSAERRLRRSLLAGVHFRTLVLGWHTARKGGMPTV
ncbi:hypothetical protein SSCH_1520004 [Syntrophaceticus schinkii]|uniref:Uncharacterized protein n=1 Tax=Syntrophaceticus schinkii TaxID=499207 RepID=A0A0B7MIY1_9FIRM|nr:hypothetical protein SSCH_1520004 [Syntrophaceticus schinkii]